MRIGLLCLVAACGAKGQVIGEAAVELAAGMDNTCARTKSGKVYCWGDDARTSTSRRLEDLDPPKRKIPVRVRGVEGARAIALDRKRGCAALANGTTQCWLDESLLASPPMKFAVTQLALQHTSICGLAEGGTIQCATDGAVSQVPDVRGAVRFDGGFDGGCARLGDGTLTCWGRSKLAPGIVGPVESFASRGKAYCVVEAGVVKCWGENSGELGRIPARFLDEDTIAAPTPINNMPPAREVVMGGMFACAIATDHTAWCWGRSMFGETGTNGNTAMAFQVAGIDDVAQLALGEFHACALRKSGDVWCWGRGNRGQLGNGETEDTARPVRVALGGPAD